jgi:hypothetical protein
MLAKQLRDEVAIDVRPGLLVLGQLGALPAGFAADVRRLLTEWTGQPWDVRIEPAAPDAESLRMIADRARADAHSAALADPMVQALLREFPGAELLSPAPPRPSVAPLRRASA